MSGNAVASRYSEAIDQKYAALALSRRVAPTFEAGNTYRQSYGRFERIALRAAESYWWSAEIADTVFQSGLSLPSDACVASDRMWRGQKFGWLWFEDPRSIVGLEPFQGILWFRDRFADGSPCIVVSTYGRRDLEACEALDTVHIFDMKPLSQLEAELRDTDAMERAKAAVRDIGGETSSNVEASIALIRFFVAAALWIEQSILSVSRHRAERHARKRAERVEPEALTDISVVLLRRRAYDSSGDETDSGHTEWTCRWIVAGHWRNQYYPSTGERVPLWIMPYVKGPEDKPLKTPGQKIFAVTR